MKKRILMVLLSVTLALGAAGCSDKTISVESTEESTASTQKTPEEGGKEQNDVSENQHLSEKERGQEVVDLLLEKLHNETYSSIAGMTKSIMESKYYLKVKDSDYGEAKHVYRVKFADEMYHLMITALADEGISLDDLSEKLQRSTKDQIMDSYVNIMVARSTTVEALAMCSVFATTDFFVDKSLAGEREMLIYTYDDAYPLVVTFIGREDGAVCARASMLLVDDFATNSPEEVKEALSSVFAGISEFLLALNISVEEL